MDPGGLVDSRALSKDVPWLWTNSMRVINMLYPLVRKLQPRLRRASDSAITLISLAVDESYAGEKGYFDMNTKTESSPDSQDMAKQRAVWNKSIE